MDEEPNRGRLVFVTARPGGGKNATGDLLRDKNWLHFDGDLFVFGCPDPTQFSSSGGSRPNLEQMRGWREARSPEIRRVADAWAAVQHNTMSTGEAEPASVDGTTMSVQEFAVAWPVPPTGAVAIPGGARAAAAAFFAALAAAVQKKRAECPNRDLVVSHALFKNAHRQAVLDAFPHETELIYLNVPTSLLGERLWARFKASGYSDEEILRGDPSAAEALGVPLEDITKEILQAHYVGRSTRGWEELEGSRLRSQVKVVEVTEGMGPEEVMTLVLRTG